MANPEPDYDPRPYLSGQTFVTAKTVPQHPHAYLLAERSTDPEGHRAMVAWLNATGEPRTFGAIYRYREVDGWLYWACRAARWSGPGLVLNRRRVEDVTEPAVCPACGWAYATAAECSHCGWKATRPEKPPSSACSRDLRPGGRHPWPRRHHRRSRVLGQGLPVHSRGPS